MRLDLSALNKEQFDAVTAGDGPLLVLAGAGTGKTRVIVYRMANLIRNGIDPERVLGITFTNKAAREMRDRLKRMYPDLDPGPWLSTFHSLGLNLLREEHKAIGYRKRFPIYDETDSRGLLNEVLRDLIGITSAESGLDRARFQISDWKNRLVSPEDALEESDDDRSFAEARAYARYQDRLTELNAVDFDDLIYRPVRLLSDDGEVRERWENRFDHILVDEYQDTNTSQYHFARFLAGERQNLCVVGDDDQSIYAFRGAEVERILSFRRDFPRAQVVTLESNYRSVGTILKAANAVIQNNPSRHEKSLRSMRGIGEEIPFLTLATEEDEAEEVVARVLDRKRRGLRVCDQAILMRSVIQARPFEEKLRFHGVPYTVIGGQSFFDRKEIRDVLAYLRLLVMPEDDIALLRILNTPRRGFGKGGREKLDAWAREQGRPLFEALTELDQISGLTSAARSGGAKLRQDLARASNEIEAGMKASDVAKQLLEAIGYTSSLDETARDAEEAELRKRVVQSFLESLDAYEERKGMGRLADFLNGISLDSDDSNTDDEAGDKLTLLTFHGAKGLEFKSVTLVGVEDQLIPHARAINEGDHRAVEEERRLFYVAITRAQDELLMTRTVSRRRFGKEMDCEESRFACEIPEQLLNRQDVTTESHQALDTDTSLDRLAELRARFGGGS